MTGPDDSQSTRPISVAELLARNGTIGAPPVGGRRRRRRGDTDSISVAELTGEIPIVTDHDIVDHEVEKPETSPAPSPLADETDEPISPVTSNGVVDHQDAETESVDEFQDVDDTDHGTDTDHETDTDTDTDADDDTDDDYAGAVSDYTAYIEQREADVDLPFFAPPRRSSHAPRRFDADLAGAEEMSPDPVDDDGPIDLSRREGGPTDVDDDIDAFDAFDAADDLKDDKASDDLPSYLRSTAGPLFGGQTVADDLARRGTLPGPEDIDLDDDADVAPPKAMSSFMRGVWVVGQCVLAVAFGAGLFIAFDQLWKWNDIIALGLSGLVILGLVAGVRVVRKTEDIGSTLIAVAVGMLVTLGPLALLRSG
jgi:hypothetical protein